MRKSLIIASESSNLYTSSRFLQEGKKLKWDCEHLNPYQSSINYQINHPQNNGLYLFRTTGIRFDDYDIYKAMEYHRKKFNVVNDFQSIQNFRCKERQIFFLKQHQMNHIPTITFRGEITPSLLENIFKLSLKNEFIIKTTRGNGGIGVQILRGKDSILSVLETFKAINDQKLLIQPYIPHQKEYRIFATKKHIYTVIEKSINKEDFRGNSKRSNGKLLKKIPHIIEHLTEKIVTHAGLDYMGIDLIINDHDAYILEINAVPGFQQIEELSQINIAKELLIEF